MNTIVVHTYIRLCDNIRNTYKDNVHICSTRVCIFKSSKLINKLKVRQNNLVLAVVFLCGNLLIGELVNKGTLLMQFGPL